MTNSKIQNKDGFSTLLVVILLGSVVLSLTLALSTSSIWSIRGSIDSKSAIIAKSLVNACAEIALETMRENNSYSGTGTVLLNNNSCSYTVADTGGSARSVTVSGTVRGITRNISITTSAFNPLLVSSWQEI